jgi:hypothetical protein
LITEERFVSKGSSSWTRRSKSDFGGKCFSASIHNWNPNPPKQDRETQANGFLLELCSPTTSSKRTLLTQASSSNCPAVIVGGQDLAHATGCNFNLPGFAISAGVIHTVPQATNRLWAGCGSVPSITTKGKSGPASSLGSVVSKSGEGQARRCRVILPGTQKCYLELAHLSGMIIFTKADASQFL